MSDSWDQDLTAAFSVLLGRPVDSFDPGVEYVLYYSNSVVVDGDQLVFDALDDAGSLTRTWRPGDDGRQSKLAGDVCLAEYWGLDLARSVFEFDFTDESTLAQAFGAQPDSNLTAEACRTVSGRELAAVLMAHDLGPADIVSGIRAGAFDVRTAFRVVTDGTLRDALLTAIRGKRGPDALRPGPDEAATLPLTHGVFTDDQEDLPPALAAGRDRLLAPIRDPRLRAHIWSPYLDTPWNPADYGPAGSARTAPPGNWAFLAARPGTTFVAAWDLAYFGEVSLAIMAMDDSTQSASD